MNISANEYFKEVSLKLAFSLLRNGGNKKATDRENH